MNRRTEERKRHQTRGQSEGEVEESRAKRPRQGVCIKVDGGREGRGPAVPITAGRIRTAGFPGMG